MELLAKDICAYLRQRRVAEIGRALGVRGSGLDIWSICDGLVKKGLTPAQVLRHLTDDEISLLAGARRIRIINRTRDQIVHDLIQRPLPANPDA